MNRELSIQIIREGMQKEGRSLDAVLAEHNASINSIPDYCLEAFAKMYLGPNDLPK